MVQRAFHGSITNLSELALIDSFLVAYSTTSEAPLFVDNPLKAFEPLVELILTHFAVAFQYFVDFYPRHYLFALVLALFPAALLAGLVVGFFALRLVPVVALDDLAAAG